MADFFAGKTVCVTGGSGTIGSELVRQLVRRKARAIRVLSNDEDGQAQLQQEFGMLESVRLLFGDVREKVRLVRAFEGCDVVFHAAALKHVTFCEFNPFEAVKTNVLGTQNAIEAALEHGVGRFVTISTDKAASPVTTMGATKLLAERLTTNATLYKGRHPTIFSCVRFGNVVNSRGSLLPIVRGQVARGGPVTVTEPEMTRFLMTTDDAVTLVLKAAELARGGEIFILKMPSARIGDVVEVAVEEYAQAAKKKPASIRIETIGSRGYEKRFEELLTADEAENAYELDDMFVLVPPGNPTWPGKRLWVDLPRAKGGSFSSENAKRLTRAQVRTLVRATLRD